MLNVTKEVRALKQMTITELRDKYMDVFGETTRSRHKQFLIKRIAWRIQALEEGELSERARKKAEELANEADLRIRPPSNPDTNINMITDRTIIGQFHNNHDNRLPMPGTLLTRKYRGETIRVMVLGKGFEWQGQVYRSLTAVAKAITGSHWNGFDFLGLKNKKGKN